MACRAGPAAPAHRSEALTPANIRLASLQDGDFIAGLVPRFVEHGVPLWRTHEEMEAGTARQLAEALARGNDDRSAILILEEDGARRGFVWVKMLDDFYGGPPMGKISEIAVTESGKGSGRRLMAAAEQWAKARGATLMLLNALETNASGRRFYSLQGYEPEYTAYVKRL